MAETRVLPEVVLEDVPDAEFELVKSALNNPAYTYRTIPGIERETQVAAGSIAAVLTQADIARLTPFVGDHGEPVFTRVEQPKNLREHLAAIRWILVR